MERLSRARDGEIAQPIKVQSAKERGFSVEFREAVNPKETAIQQNIYSANRMKRGRGERGERREGSFYKHACEPGLYNVRNLHLYR